MTVENIETLVIGGGQAGVAMSDHLGRQGVPHLVVERHRIAERWRTERWDSLVANGPAWHDRFPGLKFEGIDPDSFAGKEAIADYFVTYARQINAPIREGVEVLGLTRRTDGTGFVAETSQGRIGAANVVVATGPFQRPIIPDLVPQATGIVQMHSTAYRNPGQQPSSSHLSSRNLSSRSLSSGNSEHLQRPGSFCSQGSRHAGGGGKRGRTRRGWRLSQRPRGLSGIGFPGSPCSLNRSVEDVGSLTSVHLEGSLSGFLTDAGHDHIHPPAAEGHDRFVHGALRGPGLQP